MEDIIRQIISIEDEAQSIMRDAREAEGELENRIKTEDIKMAEDIRTKAQRRCRVIDAEEHKGINEKIDEINAHTEEQLISLEKKFKENREKWVDDMVKHIIGE